MSIGRDIEVNYLDLIKEFITSGKLVFDFCDEYKIPRSRFNVAKHIYEYFYQSDIINESYNIKIRFFLYLSFLFKRCKLVSPAEFALVYRIPTAEFYMAKRVFRDIPEAQKIPEYFKFTKKQFLKELASFHHMIEISKIEAKTDTLWKNF